MEEKKRLASASFGLLLLTSVAMAHAAYILNLGKIEKIGGIHGLPTIAKDPAKAAGVELNFANAANQLVPMAMIQPASA
jgi:hypothetical protein